MLDRKTCYQYSFILQELNAEIKTNGFTLKQAVVTYHEYLWPLRTNT